MIELRLKRTMPFLCMLYILGGCETPNAPDFKVQQKVQTPFLSEREYRFLGESDALIDTTDPGNNIFDTSNESLVVLSEEEEFIIGAIDIPVDLFDEQTAAKLELKGISTFSKQLDNLEFETPTVSIRYTPISLTDVTVYAVVLGRDFDGNTRFLKPKPGSEIEVNTSEAPDQLQANGRPVRAENMVKFSAKNGEITNVEFNSYNSNINDLASLIPVRMRFTGVAKPTSPTDTIPAFFVSNALLNFNLPIHFSASNSSFADTTDANLKELPGTDSENRIEGASLFVSYKNYLPLNIRLSFELLNSNNGSITTIPLPEQEELIIGPAGLNPASRFAGDPNPGTFRIQLSREQLNVLNQSRKLRVEGTFTTPNGDAVKLRAEDALSLSVGLDVSVLTTVEN